MSMFGKQDAQKLASNLNQAGHKVSPQDVIPTTAETPVPKSPELQEVGAEVIGEDLSHIFGTTMGDIGYGKTKTRMTKSSRFLNMFKNKLMRRKDTDEEVVEK